MNPVRDAQRRVNTEPIEEAPHYSLAEMRGILTALGGRPRDVMALGFIGLRPAEMLGLKWSDIHDDALYIARSAWRGIIGDGGR